jgi:hypothetical protein
MTRKELPIKLTDQEVRAIIEGRKTQVRTIIKQQPDNDCYMIPKMTYRNGIFGVEYDYNQGDENTFVKCPYGKIGDLLWVKETWAAVGCIGGHPYEHIYQYKADFPNGNWSGGADWCFEGWKPSIHMPYAACRLKLEITDIRVERLQPN